MPTYDFRCPQGHEFTHFYKTISGSKTQLPCPECSAVAQRQLSGGGGLVFKGSGFYLTDYGKNAHRAPDAGRQTSDAGAKAESTPADSAAKSDAAKSNGSKSDSAKSDSSGSKSQQTPKSERRADSSSAKGPSAEGPKPKSDVRRPSSE